MKLLLKPCLVDTWGPVQVELKYADTRTSSGRSANTAYHFPLIPFQLVLLQYGFLISTGRYLNASTISGPTSVRIEVVLPANQDRSATACKSIPCCGQTLSKVMANLKAASDAMSECDDRRSLVVLCSILQNWVLALQSQARFPFSKEDVLVVSPVCHCIKVHSLPVARPGLHFALQASS